MKKIVLLFFIYSSFAMAEQNIFPVHEVQNLLGYGQLEFLKPNKKNIFMQTFNLLTNLKLFVIML